MVALAVAVVIAYSNCGPNAFALDDWHAIVENPAIRGVLKAPVTKFVRTLAEPTAKLVRTVDAVKATKAA